MGLLKKFRLLFGGDVGGKSPAESAAAAGQVHDPHAPLFGRRAGAALLEEKHPGGGASDAAERSRDLARTAELLNLYATARAAYEVDVTSEDIDLLADAGEWEMVRHASTTSPDSGIQNHALAKLCEAGRFFDVLDAANTGRMTSEGIGRAWHVLSLFEKHAARIVTGDFVIEGEDADRIHHIFDFILEKTSDSEVAQKVVDAAGEMGILHHLTSNIRNKDIAKVVLDAWGEEQYFEGLQTAAEYYQTTGFADQWQHVISIFEASIDAIIEICGREEGNEEDQEALLTYVGKGTSDLGVARQVIDELATRASYDGIKEIAATADHEIEIRYGFHSRQVTSSLERQNAEEIARYAIGALSLAGQEAKLQEVMERSPLQPIRVYAQKRILGKPEDTKDG